MGRCFQSLDVTITCQCPYREGINDKIYSTMDRIEIVVSQQDADGDRYTASHRAHRMMSPVRLSTYGSFIWIGLAGLLRLGSHCSSLLGGGGRVVLSPTERRCDRERYLDRRAGRNSTYIDQNEFMRVSIAEGLNRCIR